MDRCIKEKIYFEDLIKRFDDLYDEIITFRTKNNWVRYMCKLKLIYKGMTSNIGDYIIVLCNSDKNAKFYDIKLSEIDEKSLYVLRKIKESEHPVITKVIFHDPLTIVFWSDGDKSISICSKKDKFTPYYGIAAAVTNKFIGNCRDINDLIKEKSTVLSTSREKDLSEFIKDLIKMGILKKKEVKNE